MFATSGAAWQMLWQRVTSTRISQYVSRKKKILACKIDKLDFKNWKYGQYRCANEYNHIANRLTENGNEQAIKQIN